MFAAIQSGGAVTIYPFDVTVTPNTFSGTVKRNDALGKSVISSTVFTEMIVSDHFLIVGCPTCQATGGNFGYIKAYTLDTLRLQTNVWGTSSYQYLGEHIIYKKNTDNSEQFWYSSR